MSLVLYGSSGDVRAELGNPSEAEYSADDLNRARTKATNLVNAYVSKAYPSQIPFSLGGEPELLKTTTDDLAVYYAKRAKHPGPLPLSEEVKAEYYDKSIDLLKAISDGVVELPELEGAAGDAVSSPGSTYIPIFGVDNIENQTVDPDLEDHLTDERK